MAIKIGDNNKIKKSKIIDNSSKGSNGDSKDTFANRHPIITGIGCSIIATIIMMFSFWDKVSAFVRNLF